MASETINGIKKEEEEKFVKYLKFSPSFRRRRNVFTLQYQGTIYV